MEFLAVVFIFGAILFLIGLVGKVKTAEIDIGSNNILIRGIAFVLGTSIMASTYNSMPKQKDILPQKQISEPKLDQQKNTEPKLQSKPKPQKITGPKPKQQKSYRPKKSSNKHKITAKTTLKYWNEHNKIYMDYTSANERLQVLPKGLSEIERLPYFIARLDGYIELMNEYKLSLRLLPIKNVDTDLLNILIERRKIYYFSAVIAKKTQGVLEEILFLNKKEKNSNIFDRSVEKDLKILSENINDLNIEIDSMNNERQKNTITNGTSKS
jgi:hypothetical protein